MAYVLGFFAADGYITLNKRGAHFWCIEITDKNLIQSIKKTIEAEHKISKRDRHGNNKATYRLQIGSMEMCDDLRNLGFTENKTKNLVVPNVPNKFFSDFLRGYFDGDGNVWVGQVHKERATKLLVIRCVFTSCSLDFLYALRKKSEQFGISKGVLRKGMGDYYRLTYSVYGSLKLYDFMYNRYTCTSERLLLERKKRVFERYKRLRP